MDLQHTLTEHVEAVGGVGASLGLLRDDELTVACAGSADLESGAPVDASTAFQIASVTKPMNAVVACRLAARGLLDFSASLDTTIPELAASEWAGGVRVEDLLTNIGGVPMSEATEFKYEASGDDALALLTADLAYASPTFKAGSSWSYSNAAACLLGRAIEVAAGQTYEQVLRDELFEPLQMSSTGFVHDRPPVSRAKGYDAGEDGHPTEQHLWDSRALGPAGTTVWTTAGDLLRLARPFASASDCDYLEAHWLDWLRETTTELTIPPFTEGWCRGLSVFRWAGGPVWGWLGICNGFRAFWLLVPGRRSAVALLVNSAVGAELYRAILPAVLGEVGVVVPEWNLDSESYSSLPVDLRRYCGRYAWPDTEILVELDSDGLKLSGAREGRLTPAGEDVFRWRDGDPDIPFVTFAEFDSAGRPQTLYDAVWAFPRADLAP
jgi:CubicO group peptidase (beta-lactamase class C family)